MNEPPPDTSASDEPQTVRGTAFGRYRLLEVLGRGGMGEVWRAYDTDTDRIVALKVLPEHLSHDTVFQQRFRREAHAAAQLNSPHVIPIHHYGEIDGRLYVDMRLIEGRDLATVLADGPLGPRRAVRIIEQVALALQAAHQIGLIHRDVKPSNILLDDNDYAYLIDFGIARATGDTKLTGTSAFIGSWPYMAPERFSANEADARADVYALACVLYECLTGYTPYPGDSLEQQYAGHVATPPPRPSDTNPDVPAGFDRITERGLAKDPDQRYATTVDLAQDAATVPIPQQMPIAASPAQPPPTPEHARTQTPDAAVTTPDAPHPRPTPGQLTWPATSADQSGRPRQPRRRRIIAAATGIVAVAAVAVAVLALSVNLLHRNHSGASTPAASVAPTPSPSAAQTTLPFTDLDNPGGVAVDGAGAVYIVDSDHNRVVKLAPGATRQTVLPFTGLLHPEGVAVDRTGTVYVSDGNNRRVVKLAPGATQQTVLPFTFPGLSGPGSVAVDGTGAVYVTVYNTSRVVKLAAGATQQTELPFTGLNHPCGIAVDGAGAVYVTDQDNNRVVKVAAGATQQTELPFTGLDHPCGVAVDGAGTVYVADVGNHRVVKLAPGATQQTELAFAEPFYPTGIAVDGIGTVYVIDDVVANYPRVVKVQQH